MIIFDSPVKAVTIVVFIRSFIILYPNTSYKNYYMPLPSYTESLSLYDRFFKFEYIDASSYLGL